MDKEICEKCGRCLLIFHDIPMRYFDFEQDGETSLKCTDQNGRNIFEIELDENKNKEIIKEITDKMNRNGIKDPKELKTFKEIEPPKECLFYTEHFLKSLYDEEK